MLENILASSANRNAIFLIASGKSLMEIKQNIGPSTLPWGIPLVTSSTLPWGIPLVFGEM